MSTSNQKNAGNLALPLITLAALGGLVAHGIERENNKKKFDARPQILSDLFLNSVAPCPAGSATLKPAEIETWTKGVIDDTWHVYNPRAKWQLGHDALQTLDDRRVKVCFMKAAVFDEKFPTPEELPNYQYIAQIHRLGRQVLVREDDRMKLKTNRWSRRAEPVPHEQRYIDLAGTLNIAAGLGVHGAEESLIVARNEENDLFMLSTAPYTAAAPTAEGP